MKKLLLASITVFGLAAFIFCGQTYTNDKKSTLRKGDLTGYCGWEIAGSHSFLDSCLIKFETDSTFTRRGAMYIQTEGSYAIQNDTLIVNYFCKCGQKNPPKSICCDRQKYILTKNRKLKLILMQNYIGENLYKNIPLPKNYSTSALVKCK